MSKKRTPWDYIVPVTLPSDLKGVTPGKLPANLLRPAVGGGKLHWIAAAAWAAMVEAAKSNGIELKPTSSGDTYRDYETQKRGFLQRYQTQPIPGASTKEFEGQKWYLKKGYAMLATPGKSQHNLGIAVDVHSASEPRRIKWLIDNVEKFGWSWEVVPSEPWHIRYVCGDRVPAAVKEWMDRNGVIAPNAGSTKPATVPSAESKPSKPKPTVASPASPQQIRPAVAHAAQGNKTYKIGDSGPDVRKMQNGLKKSGHYKGEADGVFNKQTSTALIKFKKEKGLSENTVVGQKIRLMLGMSK
jgi:hypothetical protein